MLKQSEPLNTSIKFTFTILVTAFILAVAIPAWSYGYSIHLLTSKKINEANQMRMALKAKMITAHVIFCGSKVKKSYHLQIGWFFDLKEGTDYLDKIKNRLPFPLNNNAYITESCPDDCLLNHADSRHAGELIKLWFHKHEYEKAINYIDRFDRHFLFQIRRAVFCDPSVQRIIEFGTSASIHDFNSLLTYMADKLGELIWTREKIGVLGKCLGGGSAFIRFRFVGDDGHTITIYMNSKTTGPWSELGEGARVKIYLDDDGDDDIQPIKIELTE